MALTPLSDFAFKHVNQADQVSGDPATYKMNMDSQAKAIRDFLNGTHKTEIDALFAALAISEGSWTPTIAGSTAAGANTYSEQAGRYYKIGKMVYISGKITMTAKDGAMAGDIRITGLPFTPEASAAMAGITIATASLFDFTAGYSQLCGRVTQGTNYIDLFQVGDNVSVATVSQNLVFNTTTITFSATYKTA